MIYLVTQQILPESEKYRIATIQEALDILEPLKIVGLDTETSGLNCHEDKLLSLQLGNFNNQVVVDCTTVSPLYFKEYLESDRLFLGWNLKFDIKWLFTYSIIVNKVWDGFLMEKLMWNGYPQVLKVDTWNRIRNPRYTFIPRNPKKKDSVDTYMLLNSLKWAGENYLGIELDKSVRGRIIWEGITSEEVIEYAANDVKYLEQIREKQIELLKERDLMRATEYENKFVIPLAYFEYCGVKIDREKWIQKMKEDQQLVDSIKKELDEWLIQNKPNSKYITIDKQGDLFTGFNLEPKVTINWNSTKQVIPILQKYGVDTSKLDKNKDTKDSIDAKVLGPQKNKCSLIPIYLKYKEATKVTSTYGKNILDQLDNKDRIYTNFNQCGADTFRLSSGGKDGNTKYINLQNLPADELTRSCFISEKGNKFISIDFSGEESVLMASVSNDKAMINELMYGEKDLHTLTAKIVFPEIPKDATAKEVKKNYHEYRQKAKGYEFLLNYMGNYYTMMQNYGISEAEAKQIESRYMKGFNGLKRYQDNSRVDWVQQGYILISPVSGHKAYIYDYDALMEDRKWMNTLDWDYYRQMKRDYPQCDMVTRVKKYFERKADCDKHSANYKIQGLGAIIFRVACVYFWKIILKKGWFNKVKLCIPVHDEIDIEAPEEIAEEAAQDLYNCMIKAGNFFSVNCRLDADISRLPDGSLPTYWIH